MVFNSDLRRFGTKHSNPSPARRQSRAGAVHESSPLKFAATLVVAAAKDLHAGEFRPSRNASLLASSSHFRSFASHDGKSTKKCPHIVLMSQRCFALRTYSTS